MSYKKLPEEFKKKWVDALRSGRYKQGKRRLYNKEEDSYCCLGVAAKICGVNLNTSKGNLAIIPPIREQETNDENWEVPEELCNTDFLQEELWKMNDMDGRSFEEIADWIEPNL